MGADDVVQLETIVIYHRDGVRSHSVDLWPGRLNVITGASETGKSALVEIVDYCLGSDRHGVYRSPELDSIGWYGLMLRIDGRPLFVARRQPDPGQKLSTDVMLIEGRDTPPSPADIQYMTNMGSVTARLGELIGIDEIETQVPEGSTRSSIRATLRHALAYVFQRQRLIADPEYLFAGQDRPFAAMAIRDTLPYFLGSVGSDALQQRRELRARRHELKSADARLQRLSERSDELLRRERSMLQQAQEAGLLASGDRDTDEIRPLLASVLDRPADDAGEPLAGEAAQIAELDFRRRDALRRLTEARAERRRLIERRRLAENYAREVVERRARLLSLDLVSPTAAIDVDAAICPLCGVASAEADPSAAELRAELDDARRQVDNARATEPRLEGAIARVDDEVARLRGTLNAIDDEVTAAVARSELAQRARSRREVQAFVRGRIAAFLEEHPVRDPAALNEASADVVILRARVQKLEQALSPETIRLKTDRTLQQVGRDMTRMARQLGLGYTEQGVRLDPIALTVVAGDVDDQVWLNEDIGSGKNWVGFHLVTLLALHTHFVTHNRPVPRMLMLDQPTQAFYPSERRHQADRSFRELPDDDQQLVRRQFALLRDTAVALKGKLQIIVTDHADIAEDWFAPVIRHEWRDGRALVPRDWYE